MDEFAADMRLRCFKFLHGCDHWKHDAQVAPGPRPQQSPQLRTQQSRAVEPDANSPPAERRVFLFDLLKIGQNFVRSNIKCAERNRFSAGRIEYGSIKRFLFAHLWQSRREHKLDFGPE